MVREEASARVTCIVLKGLDWIKLRKKQAVHHITAMGMIEADVGLTLTGRYQRPESSSSFGIKYFVIGYPFQGC